MRNNIAIAAVCVVMAAVMIAAFAHGASISRWTLYVWATGFPDRAHCLEMGRSMERGKPPGYVVNFRCGQ